MPSNKPKSKPSSSSFDLSEVLKPRNFRPADMESLKVELARLYRGTPPDEYHRLSTIFDPDIRDLAELPIAYFDTKVFCLPSDMMPLDKAGLLEFCISLIDKGRNTEHVRIMSANLTASKELSEHVERLWNIRQIDKDLFADVICGYHGRAIATHKAHFRNDVSPAEFKALLSDHLLLWSAMDVQMVACGAKVVTERPLGSFLKSDMVSVKGGTFHRLAEDMLDGSKFSLFTPQGTTGNNVKSSPKGMPLNAKVNRHKLQNTLDLRASRKGINPKADAVIIDRAQDVVQWAQEGFNPLIDKTSSLRFYSTVDGAVDARDNSQLEFHQIWYSGLSALSAAALSLIRFATAENHIKGLVEAAYGDPDEPGVRNVRPLPAPPKTLKKKSELGDRVLDLLFSVRRVHLRDYNLATRTEVGLSLTRDPLDDAGWTAVKKAHSFLVSERERQLHSDDAGNATNHQQTYWRLDVIPDCRLRLIGEPDFRLSG